VTVSGCIVNDSGVGGGGARGVGGRIVEDLARSIGAQAITESDSDGTTITIIVPHRTGQYPRSSFGLDPQGHEE
jgi:two-component sensor histidine kinase